jgi:subtilisin family serine protease
MTGTSMAAPLIAGAAAQLLQNRKSLTPRQLKSLLMRHAVSLGFKRSAQGKGEANVRFAANRIRCRRSRPNQKVGN